MVERKTGTILRSRLKQSIASRVAREIVCGDCVVVIPDLPKDFPQFFELVFPDFAFIDRFLDSPSIAVQDFCHTFQSLRVADVVEDQIHFSAPDECG